jgi:hypothetical protein
MAPFARSEPAPSYGNGASAARTKFGRSSDVQVESENVEVMGEGGRACDDSEADEEANAQGDSDVCEDAGEDEEEPGEKRRR